MSLLFLSKGKRSSQLSFCSIERQFFDKSLDGVYKLGKLIIVFYYNNDKQGMIRFSKTEHR